MKNVGRRIAGVVHPETAAEHETRQIDPKRIKAHVEETAAAEGVEVPKTILISIIETAHGRKAWAIRWEFEAGD